MHACVRVVVDVVGCRGRGEVGVGVGGEGEGEGEVVLCLDIGSGCLIA